MPALSAAGTAETSREDTASGFLPPASGVTSLSIRTVQCKIIKGSKHHCQQAGSEVKEQVARFYVQQRAASGHQNNQAVSDTSESYLRQDTANISECQVLHAGRRYREENSKTTCSVIISKPDACNK
jgi:hypothetical protein